MLYFQNISKVIYTIEIPYIAYEVQESFHISAAISAVDWPKVRATD